MFHNGHKTISLFCKANLHDFWELHKKNLIEEIRSEDDNYISSVDKEEYIASIENKFKLEALVLFWKKANIQDDLYQYFPYLNDSKYTQLKCISN